MDGLSENQISNIVKLSRSVFKCNKHNKMHDQYIFSQFLYLCAMNFALIYSQIHFLMDYSPFGAPRFAGTQQLFISRSQIQSQPSGVVSLNSCINSLIAGRISTIKCMIISSCAIERFFECILSQKAFLRYYFLSYSLFFLANYTHR